MGEEFLSQHQGELWEHSPEPGKGIASWDQERDGEQHDFPLLVVLTTRGASDQGILLNCTLNYTLGDAVNAVQWTRTR